MRILTLLLLLSLFATSTEAFQRPVPMEDGAAVGIERGMLTTKFLQNGKVLQHPSVQKTVGEYPEAKGDVTASKAWIYTGMVPAAAGGFMVGYFGTQPLFGGEFNAPLFFTGLGLACAGLVMSRLGENRLVRAVEKYNATIGPSIGMDMSLEPEQSRMALQIQF